MAGSVIHPLNLAYWATDQIIHTHQLPEVTTPQLETHFPPALSQKRLFLLLLEKTINIHTVFARFLTRLSRHVLFAFHSVAPQIKLRRPHAGNMKKIPFQDGLICMVRLNL